MENNEPKVLGDMTMKELATFMAVCVENRLIIHKCLMLLRGQKRPLLEESAQLYTVSKATLKEVAEALHLGNRKSLIGFRIWRGSFTYVAGCFSKMERKSNGNFIQFWEDLHATEDFENIKGIVDQILAIRYLPVDRGPFYNGIEVCH